MKKFAAVAIGSITFLGLALIPAGGAQAVAPVTAVANCPASGPDITTSVTVAPGQDIVWSVTGCDMAYWDTLSGPNPTHGGSGVSITDPYSTTSPADEFVCDTDQMEFHSNVNGSYAYIDIICGAAIPDPLPDTGVNLGAVAGASALLLGLGLSIVLVARRRQKA